MIDTEWNAVKNASLKYLAIREHSRQELIRKLLQKDYTIELIENVLLELNAQGLQSDLRYTECYVRHRINKGFGPLRIAQELKQRGIDVCDWLELTDQLEINWSDLIERVYIKKYTACPLMSKQQWAKQVRFLQQRGFTLELIQNLFHQQGIKFN